VISCIVAVFRKLNCNYVAVEHICSCMRSIKNYVCSNVGMFFLESCKKINLWDLIAKYSNFTLPELKPPKLPPTPFYMNKYIKTKFTTAYILQLWAASFAKDLQT